MMNVIPIQLIAMIKQGKNPQQLMLNILENQMSNTPMGANLLELAKNGKSADIEKIVRNLAAAQGIDFDKEFTSFKQMLGL